MVERKRYRQTVEVQAHCAGRDLVHSGARLVDPSVVAQPVRLLESEQQLECHLCFVP